MVTIMRGGGRMLINTATGPPPLLHHIHRHPGPPHAPPARLDMYGTISATRTVHPLPRHIDLTSREERRKWELAINETPYHKPGRSAEQPGRWYQEQVFVGDGPRAGTASAVTVKTEASSRSAPGSSAAPPEQSPWEQAHMGDTPQADTASTATAETEANEQGSPAGTSQAAPQPSDTTQPLDGLYSGHELYCGRCHKLVTSTNPVLVNGGRWYHDAHVICYMCSRPSDASIQDWGDCPLCVQSARSLRAVCVQAKRQKQ